LLLTVLLVVLVLGVLGVGIFAPPGTPGYVRWVLAGLAVLVIALRAVLRRRVRR
jgi:hypothetical protein